jgi:hypothetical protein
VTGGIRSWYVRDVLEIVERSGASIARLKERLPQRLHAYLNLTVLRAAAPTDAIPIDDGEELLLGLDPALGDGSGKILENIGLEIATRMLVKGSGGVVPGDLVGTIARMRAPFERPFAGIPILHQVVPNETGFVLYVGVAGRPRSARVLRHLALGTVRAAQRFSRGADEHSLKLYADLVADRVTLTAQYRLTRSEPQHPAPETPRRPSRGSIKPPPVANLSAEIDRILAGTPSESPPPPPAPPRRPSTSPPLRRITSPNLPAAPVPAEPGARPTVPPPAARPTIPAPATNPPGKRDSKAPAFGIPPAPRAPRLPMSTPVEATPEPATLDPARIGERQRND